MQIMFAFIVGLSLFLTNRFNEWGHTEMLCLTAGLTMGPGSVWAGAMLTKKTEELDEKVKYAALAGAGALVVLLPVFLALFYGSDYSMSWVVVTAGLSVIFSFYTYFDIVVFRDRQMFEENDYILSALYVYIDFFLMLYDKVLKPLGMYLFAQANQYKLEEDTIAD
jgi:hypothetical protein